MFDSKPGHVRRWARACALSMTLVVGLAACGESSSVAVTGVSLDRSSLSMAVGSASVELVATVAPSDATNRSVTWSSSNSSVATVSTTGVVAAIAPGTATITVTTVDGSMTATCIVTVTSATIATTGVTLDKDTLNLSLGGGTSPLVATVEPANATNKNVMFMSSNQSVATVSATGVVTPVAIGTATITVVTSSGGFTDTCAVTVSAQTFPVTSVMLNTDTLNLVTGSGSSTLVATVLPLNATNPAVTWMTSNANVASVTSAGVVAPVGVGTATITVTTVDGSHTDTVAVTVTAPVPVSGVSLDMTTLAQVAGAVATPLVATVSPANAANKNVTWSSSNPSVASVSGTGAVRPLSPGMTTITVTTVNGGFTATCMVTVTAPINPVTGVSLDADTLSMAVGGSTSTLVATVAPANADNQTVTWESSNENVATVSATGVVTAVASGTATITVATTEGTFNDTCVVTVRPDAVTAAVALTPLTGQAVITWTPAADTNATGVRVSMTSANGSAVILAPQTVPVGTARVALPGLTFPESYTISLVTLGAATTQSSAVSVPVTTTKVTYIVRSTFEPQSPTILDSVFGTGNNGGAHYDVVMARANEINTANGFPKNYRWVFYPGLADPTNPNLVSLQVESYVGDTWTTTNRWVRMRTTNDAWSAQGQWYDWCAPTPNTRTIFTDLDDDSPGFEGEATFTLIAGALPDSVAFQSYADPARRMIHNCFHIMALNATEAGNNDMGNPRFDNDSTWFLEPTSYRTP